MDTEKINAVLELAGRIHVSKYDRTSSLGNLVHVSAYWRSPAKMQTTEIVGELTQIASGSHELKGQQARNRESQLRSELVKRIKTGKPHTIREFEGEPYPDEWPPSNSKAPTDRLGLKSVSPETRQGLKEALLNMKPSKPDNPDYMRGWETGADPLNETTASEDDKAIDRVIGKTKLGSSYSANASLLKKGGVNYAYGMHGPKGLALKMPERVKPKPPPKTEDQKAATKKLQDVLAHLRERNNTLTGLRSEGKSPKGLKSVSPVSDLFADAFSPVDLDAYEQELLDYDAWDGALDEDPDIWNRISAIRRYREGKATPEDIELIRPAIEQIVAGEYAPMNDHLQMLRRTMPNRVGQYDAMSHFKRQPPDFYNEESQKMYYKAYDDEIKAQQKETRVGAVTGRKGHLFSQAPVDKVIDGNEWRARVPMEFNSDYSDYQSKHTGPRSTDPSTTHGSVFVDAPISRALREQIMEFVEGGYIGMDPNYDPLATMRQISKNPTMQRWLEQRSQDDRTGVVRLYRGLDADKVGQDVTVTSWTPSESMAQKWADSHASNSHGIVEQRDVAVRDVIAVLDHKDDEVQDTFGGSLREFVVYTEGAPEDYPAPEAGSKQTQVEVEDDYHHSYLRVKRGGETYDGAQLWWGPDLKAVVVDQSANPHLGGKPEDLKYDEYLFNETKKEVPGLTWDGTRVDYEQITKVREAWMTPAELAEEAKKKAEREAWRRDFEARMDAIEKKEKEAQAKAQAKLEADMAAYEARHTEELQAPHGLWSRSPEVPLQVVPSRLTPAQRALKGKVPRGGETSYTAKSGVRVESEVPVTPADSVLGGVVASLRAKARTVGSLKTEVPDYSKLTDKQLKAQAREIEMHARMVKRKTPEDYAAMEVLRRIGKARGLDLSPMFPSQAPITPGEKKIRALADKANREASASRDRAKTEEAARQAGMTVEEYLVKQIADKAAMKAAVDHARRQAEIVEANRKKQLQDLDTRPKIILRRNGKTKVVRAWF